MEKDDLRLESSKFCFVYNWAFHFYKYTEVEPSASARYSLTEIPQIDGYDEDSSYKSLQISDRFGRIKKNKNYKNSLLDSALISMCVESYNKVVKNAKEKLRIC